MEFGEAINRRADRGTRRWFGEMVASNGGFFSGRLPIAVQLEEIGALELAMTAIRNEAGLRSAPLRERCGPFLGTAEIEQFAARIEDAAVDGTRDDRRDLSSEDGDHGLVE